MLLPISSKTNRSRACDFDGSTEHASAVPALKLLGKISATQANITSSSYFVSNQAYGKWTFTVNKAGDANKIDVYFINDVTGASGNNGYMFRFGTDEKMYLYSVASGTPTVRITSSGTFALSTNHLIEITRNTNGAFDVRVNGASIGTNTNATYTKSNYCYVESSGDVVSNLSFEYGDGSLDLNSFERVLHSDNRDYENATNITWTGNGNHSVARSTTDKRTGSASLAITSTGAGDASTNYISLPLNAFVPIVAGEKYTIEAWARGTAEIEGSPIYTSNFGTNADGWTNLAGGDVVVGNIDGIGGQDDVLRLTSDNSTGNHAATKTVGTTGVAYKLTYKYYIPSANTTIKRLAAYSGGTQIGTINTVTDAWTTVTINYISTGALRFYGLTQLDATTFTGTNGDVFYIKDVVIMLVTLPSVTFSLGNQSKTIGNIFCVPGTFTKLVWSFQATSNEVNQPLKMYANQADIIYFDDFSLTQTYDVLILAWHKTAVTTVSTIIDLAANRFQLRTDAINSLRLAVQDKSNTLITMNTTSLGNVADNNWHLSGIILERTNGVKFLVDGSATNYYPEYLQASRLVTSNIDVGKYLSGERMNGQLGEIQIVRFVDIAQSNVNTTTLTQAYRLGIPKSWVGGNPDEVFRVDWRGATTSQMLGDRSGKGNNLTGTNIDISDQIKSSYPVRFST